ncbi:MAG: PIN domain-containing protein [Patescibacteria group bacterium]
MNGKTVLKNFLSKHKILALDTTPFIYHFEQNPKYSKLTDIVFSRLGETLGITSTTTFAESLAKENIYKNKKVTNILKSALLSIPNLTYVPVSLEIAEVAARLKVKYQLTLPDAFQVSTALISNASIFITNDEKFRKVKKPRVLILNDFL